MVREARLLDRQGRLPAAIAAYQSLLARWPALPDCWYSLALLQRKTRQFSAALQSYSICESGTQRKFTSIAV